MNTSDVEVTVEESSLLTSRAAHLPAGPMLLNEAALGLDGNVVGGCCAKFKAREP